MPRVPEYQQNVSLRPIHQSGIDVRATPDHFGAAIGRGMGQAAQGMGNLAASVKAVQDLQDEAVVRHLRNDYMRERDTLMYDPETGYMQTQGKNALDARQSFVDAMRNLRAKYAEGLNTRQQGLFLKSIETLEIDAERSSLIHNGSELKRFVVQEGAAAAENFQIEALRHVGNPAMADKYMAAAINEMRNVAAKQGLSPEVIELQERKFVSDTTTKMALQLAERDPLAADKFIKDAGERLSPEDRLALNAKLEGPVLHAKAERHLAAITGAHVVEDYDRRPDTGMGMSPGALKRAAPGTTDVAGPATFTKTVEGLMNLNERQHAGVISDFIKRSAGINIDPRTTAWCAAFVNGVLGAQGVEGTGKLNARSFLNFGLPTDAPKPGDIVVLSRGDPNGWQGHVGFFQGFDANGNIRVLGGNQSNGVNVQTFGRDKLLGFRTAGQVSDRAISLPNYGPKGLASISEKLAGISDPKEREATRKLLDQYYTSQKKMMDAQRDQVQGWVETQIATDPSFDPLKIPIEYQSILGASGMTTLMNYQEKVLAHGEPATDEAVLYQLQMEYADDPVAFSQKNIWEHKDKLSKEDWRKVTGWQQSARTDQRKALETGGTYKEAYKVAEEVYGAAGILTGNSKDAQSEDNQRRIAALNNAMLLEVQQFMQANDNRKPTYEEMRSMAAMLAMQAIATQPRSDYSPMRLFGDEATVWSGRLFERGDAPGDAEIKPVAAFKDIPADWVSAITASLSKRFGRAPTKAEIEQEWAAIAMELVGAN